MVRVDKTEDFLEKNRLEGKIRPWDSPKDIVAIYKTNELGEEVRRYSIIKEYNSYIETSKVIYTA